MGKLARLIGSFRGVPQPDPLAPVKPRVTPEPARSEELERKRAGLAFRPENGFITDQLQQRRHR